MSLENQRFYTVSAVVEQALSDVGETPHRFEQFLGWALWGYREFHFDFLQEVRAAKLAMSETKTIDLPVDYVDWTVVAGLVGGKATVLDVNDEIPLLQAARPAAGTPDHEARFSHGIRQLAHSYSQFLRDGAKPWSSKGHFRVDAENRRIIFSGGVDTGEIYLEYISDGVRPGRQTIIDPYVAEALRRYIHHQRAAFSRTATIFEKQDAHRAYVEAKNTARSRKFAFRVGEKEVNVKLQGGATAPATPAGDFSNDFSSDFQNQPPASP